MPFKVRITTDANLKNPHVLLSRAAAGQEMEGITCAAEFLFTSEIFRQFLEFLTKHRSASDPDAFDLMVQLFPDDVKEIEKLTEVQAIETLQRGAAPPEGSGGLPAFEDDD
jgi:hypothetical protein